MGKVASIFFIKKNQSLGQNSADDWNCAIDVNAVFGRDESWLGSCGGCARLVTRQVRGGRAVGACNFLWSWRRWGEDKEAALDGSGMDIDDETDDCLYGSKNTKTKKADGEDVVVGV